MSAGLCLFIHVSNIPARYLIVNCQEHQRISAVSGFVWITGTVWMIPASLQISKIWYPKKANLLKSVWTSSWRAGHEAILYCKRWDAFLKLRVLVPLGGLALSFALPLPLPMKYRSRAHITYLSKSYPKQALVYQSQGKSDSLSH